MVAARGTARAVAIFFASNDQKLQSGALQW
jgi:hypothetical protein